MSRAGRSGWCLWERERKPVYYCLNRTGEGDREKNARLDMVIFARSPSEAWKIPLSLVGESTKAAKNRVRRENSG